MFEAHEEVVKNQKAIESKEQQLAQLQLAVEHHRNQEERVRAENEQLRQQLQQLQLQQQQQHAANPATTDTVTPRRGSLQLPIQQMLAAQQQQQQQQAHQQHQAAMAALSSRGGRSESVGGSPMAAAGGSSAFASGTGGADSPRTGGSKIGRRHVDRTPPRDQDELSLTVRVMRDACLWCSCTGLADRHDGTVGLHDQPCLSVGLASLSS